MIRPPSDTDGLEYSGRKNSINSIGLELRSLAAAQEGVWYNARMTRKDIKDALDRVLTWPRERQEDAIGALSTTAHGREPEGMNARPIHQPRDRLTGDPQGGQHSAAGYGGESGTECLRRGVPNIFARGIVTRMGRDARLRDSQRLGERSK
jgi:hypothetical protein